VNHYLPGSKARALYRNFSPANKRKMRKLHQFAALLVRDPAYSEPLRVHDAPAFSIFLHGQPMDGQFRV
jgi:hypothetical protein